MAPWVRATFRYMSVGMFRLFGQRMRIQGRPLLLLTTVGAKTGRVRETTLGPAWYVNLARRPDGAAIDVDGNHVAVNADSLVGAERDRAWKRIVALAPGHGKYEQDTDREIPVVRLTPRG